MSQFKRKHLDALKELSTSYLSPLEVVVHIDLDAYYAQCEQIRLGLSPEAPVVCRQWNAIIAVNYPARAFGIKRGDTISEAKKKCPGLYAPHVATFKKGETQWRWHELPNQLEYKVSLDPFRQKSRQIFKVFKDNCEHVEKAGIDEGFFDLGPYLYNILRQNHPELDVEDREDELPPPPKDFTLQWAGKLVGEEENPKIRDWDDVCVLYASNRVAEVRAALYELEGVRCSAGIARTKILAKLGSAANKPNNQTVVVPSTVLEFLQQFSLNDIWGMGGKYGDRVMSILTTLEPETEGPPSMEKLQKYSLETLQNIIGQAEGHRIYSLVHGQEASEITTRTDVKSMQSVKQFQSKAVSSLEDCKQWIKVFSADLANRVLERDEEVSVPIRPKTVVLGCAVFDGRQQNQRSKQAAFSNVFVKDTTFDRYSELLYEAGCSLLQQLKSESEVLPCSMLRMSVTSMEQVGAIGNTVLDGFFGKSFLQPDPLKAASEKKKEQRPLPEPSTPEPEPVNDSNQPIEEPNLDEGDELFVTDETDVNCERCKKPISCRLIDEHRDWHFARDLQESERKRPAPTTKPSPKKPRKTQGDQSILKFFGKKQ